MIKTIILWLTILICALTAVPGGFNRVGADIRAFLEAAGSLSAETETQAPDDQPPATLPGEAPIVALDPVPENPSAEQTAPSWQAAPAQTRST